MDCSPAFRNTRWTRVFARPARSRFLVAPPSRNSPTAALVTVLYGLVAAPTSQPVNILLGQAVSMLIGMLLLKCFDSWMELWLRQSLATALATAAMVKLKLTHPPAGATALMFTTGNFGWGNMAALLLGNVLAILLATLINNLGSIRRQYPVYWGTDLLTKDAVAVIRSLGSCVGQGLVRRLPFSGQYAEVKIPSSYSSHENEDAEPSESSTLLADQDSNKSGDSAHHFYDRDLELKATEEGEVSSSGGGTCAGPALDPSALPSQWLLTVQSGSDYDDGADLEQNQAYWYQAY